MQGDGCCGPPSRGWPTLPSMPLSQVRGKPCCRLSRARCWRRRRRVPQPQARVARQRQRRGADGSTSSGRVTQEQRRQRRRRACILCADSGECSAAVCGGAGGQQGGRADGRAGQRRDRQQVMRTGGIQEAPAGGLVCGAWGVAARQALGVSQHSCGCGTHNSRSTRDCLCTRHPHRSDPEEGGGWGTLATYRCQDATNRLTIGFRVCEGAPAALQAYVVPAIPPKACSTVSYRCVHAGASVSASSRRAASARCTSGPRSAATPPASPLRAGLAAHGPCRLPPLCLHQRVAVDVTGLAAEQQGGPASTPFSELALTGAECWGGGVGGCPHECVLRRHAC